MLVIKQTKQLKKSLKGLAKQGKDVTKLFEVVDLLAKQAELPISFCDHELKGKWCGVRELYIESDWLLAYHVIGDELVLLLVDTGSYASMLGM